MSHDVEVTLSTAIHFCRCKFVQILSCCGTKKNFILHFKNIVKSIKIASRCGLADRALRWCESYLSLRTQTFHVNTDKSGPHSLDCSVPQGTVIVIRSAEVHSAHRRSDEHNHQLSVELSLVC